LDRGLTGRKFMTDEKLSVLFERFRSYAASIEAELAQLSATPRCSGLEASERRVAALEPLYEAIAVAPAKSLADLIMKARIATRWGAGANLDEKISASIVRDLLALRT
jgi:hypothetical protein